MQSTLKRFAAVAATTVGLTVAAGATMASSAPTPAGQFIDYTAGHPGSAGAVLTTDAGRVSGVDEARPTVAVPVRAGDTGPTR